MNDLISIIIPFFNSQKTLEKCIDSILNQTYTNFEIILVDNSSTDLSKKLVNKYVKEYKFIRYYNIEKQNTSLARNKGLKEAKGNLICFVDSDDQIHINYLKNLYTALNDADMSVCSYATNVKNLNCYTEKSFEISQEKMLGYILTNKNVQGYVWNKLFKTIIIKNNNIEFNKNLKIGEDIDFVFEYLKHCNKIAITKNKLYYYNRNQFNTVNNVANFKHTLDSWKNMFTKFKKLGLNKELEIIYYYYLKKYYEIKYYEPNFKLKNTLEPPCKLNLNLKLKLFLYENFTHLIILAKKVRDKK